jgi:hypothetical protein
MGPEGGGGWSLETSVLRCGEPILEVYKRGTTP